MGKKSAVKQKSKNNEKVEQEFEDSHSEEEIQSEKQEKPSKE